MRTLTKAQSAQRIKQLHAQGYYTKKINVGAWTLVLKSRKPFVCHSAHCHRG